MLDNPSDTNNLTAFVLTNVSAPTNYGLMISHTLAAIL